MVNNIHETCLEDIHPQREEQLHFVRLICTGTGRPEKWIIEYVRKANLDVSMIRYHRCAGASYYIRPQKLSSIARAKTEKQQENENRAVVYEIV